MRREGGGEGERKRREDGEIEKQSRWRSGVEVDTPHGESKLPRLVDAISQQVAAVLT